MFRRAGLAAATATTTTTKQRKEKKMGENVLCGRRTAATQALLIT